MPRASSASKNWRRCGRWTSTRPGLLFGRPGDRGHRDAAPCQAPPRRAQAGGPGGSSASSPAPAGCAGRRARSWPTTLARRGWWRASTSLGRRALPGVTGLLGLRRPAGDRRRSSGACYSTGKLDRESRTSAKRRSSCPAVPRCARRGVCAAGRRWAPIVGVLDVQVLTAVEAGDGGRDRTLRRAVVGAAGGGRRRSAPPRPPSGWRAPPRGSRRSEDPEGVVREAARRRARAVGLRVRASSRSPTATARSTRTSPRARSPSRFSQLDADELAAMARLGRRGHLLATPSATPPGRGFAGHEVLRRAGVGSLIVLPLVAAGERVGLRRGRRPRPHRRPGVRGHRAARAPGTADGQRAPDGLRAVPAARSSRDPLTGLHAVAPHRAPARRRRCSSTSTASARSTATAARPRATTSCAPPPGCCASSTPSGGQAFRIGARRVRGHVGRSAMRGPPSRSGWSCARRLRLVWGGRCRSASPWARRVASAVIRWFRASVRLWARRKRLGSRRRRRGSRNLKRA